MKNSAKRETAEEVYSCTNDEVLSALFIGVGPIVSKMGVEASHDLRQVSDESSAEDDDEIIRQHSRLMHQQEFEQKAKDGFIAGGGSAN